MWRGSQSSLAAFGLPGGGLAGLSTLPDRIASETNSVVQVKYTNQGSIGSWASQAKARVAMFGSDGSGIVCFLVWKQRSGLLPASLMTTIDIQFCRLFESVHRAQVTKWQGIMKCLSLSGSNQAREGRLVNALAVRGDEGRDTLR